MKLSSVLLLCIVVLIVWLFLDVVVGKSSVAAAKDDPLPPFSRPIFLDRLKSGARAEAKVIELRRRLRIEHRRFLFARHRSRVLLRTLLYRRSIATAINLACTVYGASCSTLHRRARCESGYSARSYNSASGASGLFQFLWSTWRSTPFASFSVFDPYANALAAGWMEARGRGSEWVCR
jgi:hypothetical protein